MKTFKDVKIGDSIFKYNEDECVPYERYRVIDILNYEEMIAFDRFSDFEWEEALGIKPEDCTYFKIKGKDNARFTLSIPNKKLNEWYYISSHILMFISDLEHVIKHEQEHKAELKQDFYNNINRCNRNIEYAEKFLKGLDETFTSKPTNIQVGDKIRFLESGNEYIVLKVEEDGALYVAKYFNGIRHLDIRPDELKYIERVF